MIRPHPNICKMLAVCNSPLCIVFEKLDGDIYDMATRGVLELGISQILQIGLDTASAMNHLHVNIFLFFFLFNNHFLV